jgi:hypothetical protein
MAVQDDGTWNWLTRKVTRIWREPVASDFAVIAAASLKQEKEALAAPRPQHAEITAWESEGGSTARRVSRPRQWWHEMRRSERSENDR